MFKCKNKDFALSRVSVIINLTFTPFSRRHFPRTTWRSENFINEYIDTGLYINTGLHYCYILFSKFLHLWQIFIYLSIYLLSVTWNLKLDRIHTRNVYILFYFILFVSVIWNLKLDRIPTRDFYLFIHFFKLYTRYRSSLVCVYLFPHSNNNNTFKMSIINNII